MVMGTNFPSVGCYLPGPHLWLLPLSPDMPLCKTCVVIYLRMPRARHKWVRQLQIQDRYCNPGGPSGALQPSPQQRLKPSSFCAEAKASLGHKVMPMAVSARSGRRLPDKTKD
jgi:hypothetical protein